MSSTELVSIRGIENQIFMIRGRYVMLDFHLSELYGVQTKRLNEQVKRNSRRFPDSFMFQLNSDEWNQLQFQFTTSVQPESLRSQFATLESNRGKHRKFLPYVFTEQGVAMLSSVLNSDIAIDTSITIINAFVKMRTFLLQNASVFQRLENLEIKQMKTDEKIEQIFKAIDSGQPEPDKGIFFNGQIFDAYEFVSRIIRSAKKSIVLIDNYIDESTFTHLSKKADNVRVLLLTKTPSKGSGKESKQLALDLKKANEQYGNFEVKEFNISHDRFLIIDDSELYHIGASLKDLGKKWFAFSRMDSLLQPLLKQLIEKVG